MVVHDAYLTWFAKARCFVSKFGGIIPDIDLNHIMMLQYSMLLLGSFELKPVDISDINEAQKILNMNAVELSERDIPCPFVNQQITHMLQDVAKYKCGIEKLRAFQYYSFLIFFRRSLKSVNFPTEQLRNSSSP